MQTLKYIILGDSGCGKSSIMNRYISSTFNENLDTTIGLEYGTKNVTIDDETFKIQIFDLAGQERFRSIVKSYYRGCHGILLVFDITNKQSFENLEYWYQEIQNVNDLLSNKYNPSIILLGNKYDKIDHQIDTRQIAHFIYNKNIIEYVNSSAKSGLHINDTFLALNKNVYDNLLKYNIIQKPSNTDNILHLTSIQRSRFHKCCSKT